MKHKMGYSRLNRDSAQRKALLRGLSTQLIMSGRIETNLTRAKSLRSVVEKLVTLARTDSVAGRRLAAARLYGPEAVKRLFAVVAPANKDRAGGYTRVLKLGFRPGDNARRAIIEFVDASLIGDSSKEAPVKE
jgi:large subunit ribosomal protein L17